MSYGELAAKSMPQQQTLAPWQEPATPSSSYGVVASPTSIQIVRFLLEPVDGFTDQVLRPWRLNVTNETLAVLEADASHNGANNSARFKNAALNIVTPDASHHGVARIMNGWSERRLRFHLEVKVYYRELSTEVLFNISGYSGYLDITRQSGIVDPDTPFFINSITRISKNTVETPSGYAVALRPSESYQVIADSDPFQSLEKPLGLIRPVDCLDMVSLNYLAVGAEETGYGSGPVGNSITIASTQPKTSTVGNRTSTGWFTKLAENYINANSQAEYGTTRDATFDLARSLSEESTLTDNPVVRQLVSIRRNRGVSNANLQAHMFTPADLEILDPTVIADLNRHNERHSYRREAVEVNGSDNETIAAYYTLNTMSNIMTSLGVTVCPFMANNRGGFTQVFVDWQKFLTYQTLTELQRKQKAFEIETRFNTEIMNVITFGNLLAVSIDGIINLGGESTINVQMESYLRPFVFPSFADGAIAPVVTGYDQNNTAMNLENVAHSVETIVSRLC